MHFGAIETPLCGLELLGVSPSSWGSEISVPSHVSAQARAYRSPLRGGPAVGTKSRILDASLTILSEPGYGGTSLAKIADIAGVSVESVKASGAKHDLLLVSFERSFVGLEGSSRSLTMSRSLRLRWIATAVEILQALSTSLLSLTSAVVFVGDAPSREGHLMQCFVRSSTRCRVVAVQACSCSLMSCGIVALRPR